MIIYYPVSSLVTLFANILQNPQDARARTDLRLMNQVVNFLSLLSSEETGGVKRMLGVCTEFERIAKVVLDKADKESHSRRKRKSNKGPDETPITQAIPAKRPVPPTPEPTIASTPSSHFTPSFTGDLNTPPFNPSLSGFNSPTPSSENTLIPDFINMPSDFPNMMTSTDGLADFSDMPQYQLTNGPGGNVGSPLYVGSFQQPFVPQDLWQMPMTLEWDWADLSGNNVGVAGVGTGTSSGRPSMTNDGFQPLLGDNGRGRS